MFFVCVYTNRGPSANSVLSAALVLSWSSGKDNAWALHLLRQEPIIEIVALLTTSNHSAGSVAMRRELVEAQAERTGLPLWSAELAWPCPNNEYDKLMSGVCRRAANLIEAPTEETKRRHIGFPTPHAEPNFE